MYLLCINTIHHPNFLPHCLWSFTAPWFDYIKITGTIDIYGGCLIILVKVGSNQYLTSMKINPPANNEQLITEGNNVIKVHLLV